MAPSEEIRGKATAACGALGQTLCTSSMSRAPSPALPASLVALDGLESLLMLSAPGTVIFCGYRCLDEFPPWGNRGCRCLQRRQSTARHYLSPPAFSKRLAWRPAAFHCCLFIRVNSLRFLSCSLRGTEGELVPADGPHPLHPALLERGLEKRDGGEGVSPTPPGPRVPPACSFPANTVSVQPKNVSLIS